MSGTLAGAPGGGLIRGAKTNRSGAVDLPPGRLSQMGQHPSGPKSASVDLRDAREVGFQFGEQHSDVGNFWVMRDSDRDGFWNLAFPVVPRPSR